MPGKIRYEPSRVAHVWGQYDERTYDEEGLPNEQVVEAWCTWPGCQGYYRNVCRTGHTKDHINRFAFIHYHGDPFNAEHVARNLRSK